MLGLLRTSVIGGPLLLGVGVVVVPLAGLALAGGATVVRLAAVRRSGVVGVVIVPAAGRGRRLTTATQAQLTTNAPPSLVPLDHWNVRSLTP